MRSHTLFLAVLLSGTRAIEFGNLENVAGLLDKFPGIKSVLGSELSRWSTSTAEASSFICSIWNGETPAPIAAALTAAPNSDISSEWTALSTDVSSISTNSEVPAVNSACSTLFQAVATITSSGRAKTVNTSPATVTITVTVSPSQLSCPSSPTGSSSSSSSCKVYYKVLQGDTCDNIASGHNVSVSKLEQWNPRSCGPNLNVGEELCISGPRHGRAPPYGSFPISNTTGTAVISGASTGTAPPSISTCAPKTCCKHYKVLPNDTCYSIASSHQVPVSKLAQWNPNKCGPNLEVGVELCISGGSSFGSSNTTTAPPTFCASSSLTNCCQYYEVISGDTCYTIASNKTVSESFIEEWNPGQCGADLQIGTHLCVEGPRTGAAQPFGTCPLNLTSSCCHFQMVAPGDSCFSIATAKGISESFLEDWNAGMCGPGLQKGVEICVMGQAALVGFGSTTSVSSPTVTSTGSSIAGSSASSSSPARVTNSPGQRIQALSAEGLFALLITGILL